MMRSSQQEDKTVTVCQISGYVRESLMRNLDYSSLMSFFHKQC